MDSSSRDSKVNPIAHLEAEKAQLRMESVRKEENEEQTLLVPSEQKIEEVKPKRKRKVQWNDTNGNNLAEIMEFFPSDVSDSDNEESDSCFCIIM